MRTLLSEKFDISIDIESGSQSILLIIENKQLLFELCMNLYRQQAIPTFVLVDEEYKEYNMYEVTDFIYSLFSLEINDKKNLNAINKQLKRYFSNELASVVDGVVSKIDTLAANMEVEFPIDVYYDMEIKEDDILKLMNFRINDKYYKPLEKIINYIKVSNELRETRLFIFFQLSTYLSQKEIELLLKECRLLRINIICIENNQEILENSFDFRRIVDQDICLIK